MRFILFSGRTIRQGNAVESKLSPEYRDATSVLSMTPFDMMDAGLEEGNAVLVKGPGGQVVLTYANHLTPPETHATGMPDYKAVPVEVEKAEGKPPTVWELMRDLGGVPHAP
jgi:formylmethanofuran dehydrogenase subunit D